MNKQIFFTSDLHIGHSQVLVFDQRPFKDLEEMHRKLISNFNKTVPKDGLTYFLGDIGFGGTKETRNIITQLNGIKIIIAGNHDKNTQSLYNMGFDAVLQNATIKIHNQLVTMSHCPLLGVYRENTEGMKGDSVNVNWHGENKLRDFSMENKGQFHLHAHLHTGKHRKTATTIQGRQMDVGVCANGYRPVHIKQIESWIMKTLKEEACSLQS